MTMKKAYKVRLYPNKSQAEYFAKAIGCSRAIYNMMLFDAKEAYKAFVEEEKGMTDAEKKKHKNTHKPNYSIYAKQDGKEFFKEVEARALNYAQQNLNTAYKNFFTRRNSGVGFPVFKKKTVEGSFQSDKIKVLNGKLIVPKCPGYVQFRNYEEVDFEKMVTKTITISRSASGKYFASILCDVDDIEPLPKTGKTIGIDLGVSTMVSFDDVRKIDRRSILTKKKIFRGNRNGEDPRVKELRNQIEFYQKKLSKSGVWTIVKFTGKDGKEHEKRKLVEETGNYRRYKQKIASLTEKLYNIRKDFINNVARAVIEDADVVCMEDLNVKNMQKDDDSKTNRQNATAHRNIAEASMAMLSTKIKAMATMYGKTVVEVNPQYTSRTCHCCGNLLSEKLETSVREWTCAKCGAHHDRDTNAAINILQKGLDKMQK